jgi:NAD(P)-dependent dehydrogenase (short-subunit alcohol dehydrogenase family)
MVIGDNALMLLAGRTAVVTGGSSGIGREVALLFAREGASVALLDVAVEAGEALAAELGDRGSFVRCDVSSRDDVDRAFAELAPPDVLVNCAGIREIVGPLELEADDWARVIGVNLSGTFYCSQAAARLMAGRGGGSIVNIASGAGLVAAPNRPAYTTSKTGVIGLTRSFAADLGRHRIRVNAVCPGLIRTPLTEQYFADEEWAASLDESLPLGGPGLPEHVAQAVLFLASPMSAYVTGIALPVDGGFLATRPLGRAISG